MPNLILPVAKKIYVCDDVVRDPLSGKVSVLNLWESVRASGFPYVLDKICVFAQFRGGLGDVPFRIEIAHSDTGDLIRKPVRFNLFFQDRTIRHDVMCKMREIAFPAPGTYFVAMFCHNGFVDDQPIRVISERF